MHRSLCSRHSVWAKTKQENECPFVQNSDRLMISFCSCYPTDGMYLVSFLPFLSYDCKRPCRAGERDYW